MGITEASLPPHTRTYEPACSACVVLNSGQDMQRYTPSPKAVWFHSDSSLLEMYLVSIRRGCAHHNMSETCTTFTMLIFSYVKSWWI